MLRKASGVLAAAALVASLAISTPAQAAGVDLTGEGSGFAYGLISPAQAAFNALGGAQVNYKKSKSGTGRTNFKSGSVDFAATDATYVGAGETAPANTVTVPLFGAPIAIAYNLPTVGPGLKLTPTAIGQIFDGTIKVWNDAKIASLNPGVDLPDDAIAVKFRSAGSGTSTNLVDYLVANKVGSWTAGNDIAVANGKGTVGVSAADAGAMVTAIKTTLYSIGYADLSDVQGKHLAFAKVKNAAGAFVSPTVATAAKFLSAQTVPADGQLKIAFTKKVVGGYNLSALTYGLGSSATAVAAKAAGIQAFYTYVINKFAPSQGAALGYVSLTGSLKAKALALVKKIK